MGILFCRFPRTVGCHYTILSSLAAGFFVLAFSLASSYAYAEDHETPKKTAEKLPQSRAHQNADTMVVPVGRPNLKPQSNRVTVEQPFQFPFPFATPKRRPGGGSGMIAYVDDEGNLIPRPPGVLPPTRSAPLPGPFVEFVTGVPGGGIGIDTSHIKAFTYATVGADGTLTTGCVQGTQEDFLAVVAGEKRGSAVPSDVDDSNEPARKE